MQHVRGQESSKKLNKQKRQHLFLFSKDHGTDYSIRIWRERCNNLMERNLNWNQWLDRHIHIKMDKLLKIQYSPVWRQVNHQANLITGRQEWFYERFYFGTTLSSTQRVLEIKPRTSACKGCDQSSELSLLPKILLVLPLIDILGLHSIRGK